MSLKYEPSSEQVYSEDELAALADELENKVPLSSSLYTCSVAAVDLRS